MISIIKNQIKRIFSSPGNVISFLIIPMITFTLFTLINNQTYSKYTIDKLDYLDLDKTALSNYVVEKLDESYNLNEYKNRIDFENDYKHTTKTNGVIIPEDFSKNILSNNTNISILTKIPTEITESLKLELNSIIDRMIKIKTIYNTTTEEGLLSKLKEYDSKKNIVYEKKVDLKKEIGAVGGIGITMMLIMFNSVIIVKILSNDRENNTLNRIRLGPVYKHSIILANILVGIIIYFFNILSFKIILQILNISLSIRVLLVIVVVGLITQLMGIFALFNSKNSAQVINLSGLIISLLCMLGGCFWPLDIMSEGYKKVASITPQYWAMQIANEYASYGTINYYYYLALLGFAILFFALSSYALKRLEDIEDFI